VTSSEGHVFDSHPRHSYYNYKTDRYQSLRKRMSHATDGFSLITIEEIFLYQQEVEWRGANGWIRSYGASKLSRPRYVV